jgi:pimeloyl-ACP methyl ester carboxylesterase
MSASCAAPNIMDAIVGWDGVAIPADWEIARVGGPMVVLVHGIFSSRNEDGRFVRLAAHLAKHGFNSVRYDQRCHGDSPEPKLRISADNHVLDLISMLHIAAARGSTVYLVASSYGAAVALLAASLDSFPRLGRVVLLNPVVAFDYVFLEPRGARMVDRFTPEIRRQLSCLQPVEMLNGVVMTPQFWLQLQRLDPARGLSAVAISSLVVHGDADTLVDYDETRRRCLAAGVKGFHTIVGADHAFDEPAAEAESFRAITEWLELSGA